MLRVGSGKGWTEGNALMVLGMLPNTARIRQSKRVDSSESQPPAQPE
jgi:hypothetical protein